MTLASQIGRTLGGRRIDGVEVDHSAHAFAGCFADPAAHPALLAGRSVSGAASWGVMVEIATDDTRIVLDDGANPRLFAVGAALPAKHQLRLRFDEGSSLVLSIHLYGAIQAFHEGELDPHSEAAATPTATCSAGRAGTRRSGAASLSTCRARAATARS